MVGQRERRSVEQLEREVQRRVDRIRPAAPGDDRRDRHQGDYCQGGQPRTRSQRSGPLGRIAHGDPG